MAVTDTDSRSPKNSPLRSPVRPLDPSNDPVLRGIIPMKGLGGRRESVSPAVLQLNSKPPHTQRRIAPGHNEDGKLECIHCHQTFDRKCEWKHMDKHERPHKCENLQCATLLGFTYAGGLLRHKREVHNKHDELEGQLVCPYKDCKRHTSKAFTRRENLQEHLRRIHKIQGTHSVDAVAQDTPRLGATPYDHDPDNEGRASKRKRRSTMCHTEDPSEKSIRAQILEVKVENLELHHMWETQSRQLHEMREEINQFPAYGNIHLPGWRSDGTA